MVPLLKIHKRQLFTLTLRFVWMASLVLVAYLSLVPDLNLHIQIRNIDKAYHSLAYLWLAAVPFLGFQSLAASFASAILMVPFGIAIEYAQKLIGHGRFFSVGDMIANAVGVALGIALGIILKSWFFSKSESDGQ